jgi:Tol biopolymer transport system component
MPKNDGILRLDMATGEEKCLFSIRDIINIRATDTMQKAEHYFNHLLFNPEASRFLLVHLWVNEGKRYSRLITSDRDGKNIYVMNNEGHSSHYCWRSNTQLLVYTTYAKTGTHYYLCEDMSDNRKIIGEGILTKDGHPSFFPYSNIIITDTYPDKYRDQSLITYNLDNYETKILSKFYIPIKFYGETRCDLHPRLSATGAYVCIDNVQNKCRRMTVIATGF